jgi:hypothetical protein
VCGRRGNEGKMPSSGRNTVEAGTDEAKGVQFTHLARLNRTLFFETSISDR